MRLACLFIALMAAPCLAAADEPPAWTAFETRSANGRYLAAVSRDQGQVHEEMRLPGWRLTVFELRGGERDKLWECRYDYDGYAGELLSADGRTFVYLSSWYRHDEEVLKVYRDGQPAGSLTGREINFDRNSMIRTASHLLWLEPGKAASLSATQGLVLHLIDGRRLVIPLEPGLRRQ